MKRCIYVKPGQSITVAGILYPSRSLVSIGTPGTEANPLPPELDFVDVASTAGAWNGDALTFVPLGPTPEAEMKTTARARMKTLADKGGKGVSVQERDELNSLIARMLLGDI